jgi:hypothetical protein
MFSRGDYEIIIKRFHSFALLVLEIPPTPISCLITCQAPYTVPPCADSGTRTSVFLIRLGSILSRVTFIVSLGVRTGTGVISRSRVCGLVVAFIISIHVVLSVRSQINVPRDNERAIIRNTQIPADLNIHVMYLLKSVPQIIRIMTVRLTIWLAAIE